MSKQDDRVFPRLTKTELVCTTAAAIAAAIGLTVVLCFAITYDYHYRLKSLEIMHQEDKSNDR